MRAARRRPSAVRADEQLVEQQGGELQRVARVERARAGRARALTWAAAASAPAPRAGLAAFTNCSATDPGPRRPAWCAAAPPPPAPAARAPRARGRGRSAPARRAATPRSADWRTSAPDARVRVAERHAPLRRATRRGRRRPTCWPSAARLHPRRHELGGREQPGHRRRASSRHWSSASNSGSLSSWRSRLYASGRPLSVARKPVRSPMSRPALPRASSAMSGFFFCGSIDEPVLYASARRRKPNSSLDHSTISSPRRERCTCVERGDEQRLGHEVAVGDRVERVVEAARRTRARPRCRRDRAGRLEPASAPAPSGDTSARAERVAPALDVARERPEVREEVVREQHRLRALQVRVAGEVDVVGRARRTSSSTSCSRWTCAATSVPSRRRKSRSAVATWSLRLRPVWSLAPGGAGELGDPALDRGVDVLVGRRELERARRRARLRRGRARRAPSRASSSVSSADARRASATCAREPARSSGARRRSNDRLSVNASSSSAGPSAKRPCQSGHAGRGAGPAGPPCSARPRLDRQAPEAHEAGGVLVAEACRRRRRWRGRSCRGRGRRGGRPRSSDRARAAGAPRR